MTLFLAIGYLRGALTDYMFVCVIFIFFHLLQMLFSNFFPFSACRAQFNSFNFHRSEFEHAYRKFLSFIQDLGLTVLLPFSCILSKIVVVLVMTKRNAIDCR